MRGLAVAIAVASAACGSEASCPRDLPASCPTPAPSYQAQVKGLIGTYCGDCHSPTGQASDRLLDTYDHVFQRRSTVLSFTYSCAMPPAEFPQPTEVERVAILGWLVCGALDD